MKKQRNHSQIKDQENSPKRTMFQYNRLQVQKGGNKDTERRKAIDRNASYCEKGLESIKRRQSKLENSFAEMKAKLKAINGKLDNAEE